MDTAQSPGPPGSTSPSPTIRARLGASGEAIYRARWRSDGKQHERTIGPAWLESDGAGGLRKRRGRTAPGYLDERTVHHAAALLVEAVEAELEAARVAVAAGPVLTFRELAAEWLLHLERVEDAKPSTLRNYRSRLAEPGTPHRRGSGTCDGRIMAALGDRPVAEVTPKEVAAWLRSLDDAGLAARNVNQHRQIVHAIYVYGMRADTHELPSNPASGTPRRREAPPDDLDHYEQPEVEALARACEAGLQRTPPNYLGVPTSVRDAEQAIRAIEDEQDADFFRLLFYSGLRLGEALALRWSGVRFLPDMSGAVIFVKRNISDGQETSTKSRQTRAVPVPRAGAEALARLAKRTHFLEADDYVFCSRIGARLDGSAVRRRYHRAAAAIGLRRIKLHGLRHATGSVLARSMPLVSVRDILGHSKLQTTNRYLHSKVDASAVAAVNAAFGAREEGIDLASARQTAEVGAR